MIRFAAMSIALAASGAAGAMIGERARRIHLRTHVRF
jgi:hypothetical protein